MNELNLRELLRWTWRQLTSMRTALMLLLLLALAAVPGSVVPQADVDALKASQWQDAHPKLTPIYEKLGLFDVYASPWFAAIYLLLAVSLVGCIVPRTRVYFRAMRARPPKAPRNLVRLPDHATYTTDEDVDTVLERTRTLLRRRRFRVDVHGEDGSVAAERGYLREAGNLVFHLSILVVMAGFAVGSLFGYQGGVILTVGNGFSNNLTQYDDFNPGALFRTEWMEPFSFDLEEFDVEWLYTGRAAGQARKFVSHLTYTAEPGGEEREYDLRVNHPLTIGGTDVFLIGHGYAPVISVKDADGEVLGGPSIFLPTDMTFRSFGVLKAVDARPEQIALEGEFYPTYDFDMARGPYSLHGAPNNPVISMQAYVGDIGLDDGRAQSVYVLDKSGLEVLTKPDGSMFRVDLRPGESVELPGGHGTVTFEGLERWNKIQISRTPGKLVALGGVVLALLGLVGSLYVRPRRVWVRARRTDDGRTVVEIGGLDRSAGGTVTEEIEQIAAALAPTEASVPGQKEKS